MSMGEQTVWLAVIVVICILILTVMPGRDR